MASQVTTIQVGGTAGSEHRAVLLAAYGEEGR
jgi:hypothetical protein